MAKECKNCAHESDFKKHECGTCTVSYYDGEPLGLPSNFKPKPMTNADRIRAMSDGELVKLIGYNSLCDQIQNIDRTWCNTRAVCGDCLLEWLKHPAEEGADNG